MNRNVLTVYIFSFTSMTPNPSAAQLQLQHEFQGDKLGHWNTLTTKLKSSNLQEGERWGKQEDVNKWECCLCLFFFFLFFLVEMLVGKDGGHGAEKKRKKRRIFQPIPKQVMAVRDGNFGGLCPSWLVLVQPSFRNIIFTVTAWSSGRSDFGWWGSVLHFDKGREWETL